MSQLTDAADQLLAHITKLEAFKTAANALYGLDALATAEAEAKSRRQVIETAAATAEDELAATKKAMADAVSGCDAECAKMREEARAQSQAIQLEGIAEADRVKAKAHDDAVLAQQDERQARLRADQAQAEHDAVRLEIDAARQTLAELTGKIEKAQAKIAAMLS